MPGKRRLQTVKADAVKAATVSRRLRRGGLPELAPAVAIPYANTRSDAPSAGRVVRDILDSQAWHVVIKPVLDELEQQRQSRRKVKPVYTSEELESVFLYQVVCGLDTVGETRAHLTSHLGQEARRLLGFTRPRQSKGQRTPAHFVPSEASLSRHRLSFAPTDVGVISPTANESTLRPTVSEFKRAEAERLRAASAARADLYEALLARWVEERAETAAGQEAGRLLFMDGTTMSSFFNCLITKDGVPQNDEPRPRERCRVKPVFTEPGARGQMAWDGLLSQVEWEALSDQDPAFRRYWKYSADGGYQALAAGESRSGHGYNVVSVVDADGLPLAFAAGPIQAGERLHAFAALEKVGRVLPAYPSLTAEVSVLAADAGFTGFEMRDAIRDLGLLECIHPVSGSNEAHDLERQRGRSRIIHQRTQRETWLTDGHRNLLCECGGGTVNKRFHRDDDGRLTPRLEGSCRNCGAITITSGDWRRTGKKWKHRSTHPGGDPDLLMGNPLTFTNPFSQGYARRRFAVQEGAHSIIANRFGLIRGRRRVKTLEEVRVRTAMTYCALHGIAYSRALAANSPQGSSSRPTQLRQAA